MSIYDGVVTLAEDDIPVIVELLDGHVRLSASGREIGDWPVDECEIVHLEDTIYTISAENETLRFVPSQPGLFAAAIDDGRRTPEVIVPADTRTEIEPEAETETRIEIEVVDDGIAVAPPPRPLTKALFYALCALTAGMGIWAIVQMTL